MAFSIICVLVLMAPAMTRMAMIASDACLSVERRHLVRVICDQPKEAFSVYLGIDRAGCSRTQVATLTTGENDEVRRLDVTKAEAVHGFIDTDKNVKRSFLEISILEFLPVDIASNYSCNFNGGEFDENASHSANIRPYLFRQAVDIFRCDLQLETSENDDIYMEIVEKNGEHENFVGPPKTSIKGGNDWMQQLNPLKTESAGRKTNITVFMRTSTSLIVAQPAERYSASTKYFCRVTRNNQTTITKMSHRCSPDNDPFFMMPQKQVAEEERSLVWLGYPVLCLLLLVVTGLYVRERWLRCRRSQGRRDSSLEMNENLEAAVNSPSPSARKLLAE